MLFLLPQLNSQVDPEVKAVLTRYIHTLSYIHIGQAILHTYVHTYIHTLRMVLLSHIHTLTHTYIHTYILFKLSYIHTYTHTYIHTLSSGRERCRRRSSPVGCESSTCRTRDTSPLSPQVGQGSTPLAIVSEIMYVCKQPLFINLVG